MSKKRKAWRAKQQAAIREEKAASIKPRQLKGRARREYIEAQAREIYLAEGGRDLDVCIRNGMYTLAAFESQMLAAHDGEEGWGPDVSVYEARMNRSLQERLLRLKRTLMRDARQMIEAELAEESEEAEESSTSVDEPADEPAQDEPEQAPAELSDPTAPETRPEVVSRTDAA
jgi:hypothetical protein